MRTSKDVSAVPAAKPHLATVKRALLAIRAPDPAAVTVTAPELGKALDISERTVRTLASQGVFRRTSRGRYDLAVCKAAFALYRADAGRHDDALERAKLRLVTAQADVAEAKLAKERAALMTIDEARATWKEIVGRIRAGVMSVPARCAVSVPGLTRADLAVIEEEVLATLSMLPDKMPGLPDNAA